MLFIPRFFTPIPCLSITRVICVKTAERIIEIFLPSDRPIILVFRHQGSLRKSGASPPTRTANTRDVAIFDQYAAISRKRCIRSTPCLVPGHGFRGQQIEWR